MPQLDVPRRGDSTGDSGAEGSVSPAVAPHVHLAVPRRVLGVDYGTKWTGLALGWEGTRCEELQVLRQEREVGQGSFARAVLAVALQHRVEGILVGLPLDPHNPQSLLMRPEHDSGHGCRCREFAHALTLVARPHGIQVLLLDEAGTSSDALRMVGVRGHQGLRGLKSTRERLDKKVDSLSAALLVRRFQDKPGAAVRVLVRTHKSFKQGKQEPAPP